MSAYALVLLVSGPHGEHQVLVGSDDCAYRKAFGGFVRSWGEDRCWYDEGARELGCEAGITLGRWRARQLAPNPSLAVIVSLDDRAVGVYLVTDRAMARRTVRALQREGVTFDVVETEPLPEGDPEIDSLPLSASVRVRHGAIRPHGPRPPLSEEFCGRCQDYPLHVDPLFDARDERGRRLCVACARLATLRESA